MFALAEASWTEPLSGCWLRGRGRVRPWYLADVAKTASELSGIFLPVRDPVGQPIDGNQRPPDPWTPPPPVALTPEQYARQRVTFASTSACDNATRFNIPNAEQWLHDAAVLRAWLLNGAQALAADEIGVVRTALAEPINEPTDPLATPADVVQRRRYIRQLDGELAVVQASRR
jgi:hypothetical protein